MKVVIFDVDGTIADNSHRVPHIQGNKKNWDLYNKGILLDTPIQPIINMLNHFGLVLPVIILTGRLNKQRTDTMSWINRYVPFPFIDDYRELKPSTMLLITRNNDDKRPNHIYKKMQIQNIKQMNLQPVIAVDDDEKCLAEFRKFHIDTINPQQLLNK